jgi:hypothetical protein
MPDFRFTNHGSVWLAEPLNEEATRHLLDNVSEEAQWHGTALAVEPRYVAGLIHGLQWAGFNVDWESR